MHSHAAQIVNIFPRVKRKINKFSVFVHFTDKIIPLDSITELHSSGDTGAAGGESVPVSSLLLPIASTGSAVRVNAAFEY